MGRSKQQEALAKSRARRRAKDAEEMPFRERMALAKLAGMFQRDNRNEGREPTDYTHKQLTALVVAVDLMKSMREVIKNDPEGREALREHYGTSGLF